MVPKNIANSSDSIKSSTATLTPTAGNTNQWNNYNWQRSDFYYNIIALTRRTPPTLPHIRFRAILLFPFTRPHPAYRAPHQCVVRNRGRRASSCAYNSRIGCRKAFKGMRNCTLIYALYICVYVCVCLWRRHCTRLTMWVKVSYAWLV